MKTDFFKALGKDDINKLSIETNRPFTTNKKARSFSLNVKDVRPTTSEVLMRGQK